MAGPLSVQMLIDLGFDPVEFAKAMRQLADDVESGSLIYVGKGGLSFDFENGTITVNSSLVLRGRDG